MIFNRICIAFLWRIKPIIELFLLYVKKKQSNNLCVLRLDDIGDYILFRNFIKHLKESELYNKYNFIICGNIAWKNIAETFDNEIINDFVWINKSEFVKDIKYRYKILFALRKKRFDVLIHPTYSRDSLSEYVAKYSCSRYKITSIGDAHNQTIAVKKTNDKNYDKLVAAKKDVLFEFIRNKEFVENLLGVKIKLQKPSIKINTQKENNIVIFPGAAVLKRKWSVNNFIQLIDELHFKFPDYKIIVTGSKKEFNEGKLISEKCPFVDNLINKTSLVKLVAIISESKLLISNETSAVHIGVAVNVNTICISNGNLYGRFNPYPDSITTKVTTIYPPIIDKTKYKHNVKMYSKGSNIDIDQIKVETVLSAVVHVLSKKM